MVCFNLATMMQVEGEDENSENHTSTFSLLHAIQWPNRNTKLIGVEFFIYQHCSEVSNKIILAKDKVRHEEK